MKRNLKMLGLALVAVFALSAVAASAASADLFHTAKANATITSTALSNQKFQYEEEGATVECTAVHGDGSLAGTITNDAVAQTATAVTFAPVYTGCTIPAISGSSVDVNFHSCDYLFTITPSETKGETHVKCSTPGDAITLTVTLSGSSICTFHIGEQTPAGESDYTNGTSGGHKDVTVKPTQTGIHATKTNDNGFGFLCGAASSTTGTYTGEVTVTADESGTNNQIDTWVE